jgi:hypothetical protein
VFNHTLLEQSEAALNGPLFLPTPPPNKPKSKESDLQRQILDYLALKRIFAYRNNTGAFSNGHGGFYRFGAIGSPVITCVIAGQYVGIEVKRPGGKQSDHQKEFQANLEAAGGKYVLLILWRIFYRHCETTSELHTRQQNPLRIV